MKQDQAQILLNHFAALACRLGEPSFRGRLYVYGKRPVPGQPLEPVFTIDRVPVERDEALAYLLCLDDKGNTK